jgi:NAD(P)-dependent dehydrogenase (short-subunit alcohol dehydrogenase family)
MPTSLVTGANRGIGLELVKQLRGLQHRVYAVCRKSSAELAAVTVDVLSGIDVSTQSGQDQLRAQTHDAALDWVIANAGILHHDTLKALDFEAARKQFEVNALGALRTVHAVLPRLQQGSKIALITSRMGSIEDNSSGNYYGYRMSKAALNAAGKSLAHDLKARGIAVAILHPGYVRTEMTALQGGIDPSTAAAQLLERMHELTLETSGTFWHANGEVLPW